MRKGSEPCVPGVAGDSVRVGRRGEWGGFSWRQTGARNKLQSRDLSRRKPPDLLSSQKGGGYKEKSQPGFHPQGGWGDTQQGISA